MTFHASSYLSTDTDSGKAASITAQHLKDAFSDHPLKTVIVYASVNHDHGVMLATFREVLGASVEVVGCSAQGAMANGVVREHGYVLSAMGLGGESLRVASVIANSFEQDTREKARKMGRELETRLGSRAKLAILLYDPLCGADAEELAAGLDEALQCPLIGGGASQPFGPVVRTYQYWHQEVLGHAALVVGLAGDFTADIGISHGTSPTGIIMEITKSEGNKLLEIDGRPALDVYMEVSGCTLEQARNQENAANWAVGVEREELSAEGAEKKSMYYIRAAFGFDAEAKAVILQAPIPANTKIMFHHRTVADVVEGTEAMARDLVGQLNGRKPWAVLGFECGARTVPFLGEAATMDENRALHRAVAPEVPWCGMLAWGEIAPIAGKPAFHNYTFPLAVLSV